MMQDQNQRVVQLNSTNIAPKEMRLLTNIVRTAKYNVVNFLPLNLINQFKKLANCYFLMITVMQTIRSISISDGKPV